jgi:hypothetical protein
MTFGTQIPQGIHFQNPEKKYWKKIFDRHFGRHFENGG